MSWSSSTTGALRITDAQRMVVYERGLARCQNGDWEEGLRDLAKLAKQRSHGEVPALCFAYLGYGLAHRRGKISQGLRLCRRAVKREFYQPECYVLLARTALLADRYRREAAGAVREGLEIDRGNPELLELQRELGARKPPMIGFLSRRNVLNQVLGWIRHQLTHRERPAPQSPPD